MNNDDNKNKNFDLEKNMMKDFQEFLTVDPLSPPEKISHQILEKVQADFHPSPWFVFSKMTLIHLVLGTLVLLICPHFGIHVFDQISLMHLFMKYGDIACMMGCGAVFLGQSSLVLAFTLKPQEIKVIRSNRILQLSLITIVSIGTFICLGTSTLFTLGLAWTIGALLGGLATFELGHLFRSRLWQKN